MLEFEHRGNESHNKTANEKKNHKSATDQPTKQRNTTEKKLENITDKKLVQIVHGFYANQCLLYTNISHARCNRNTNTYKMYI